MRSRASAAVGLPMGSPSAAYNCDAVTSLFLPDADVSAMPTNLPPSSNTGPPRGPAASVMPRSRVLPSSEGSPKNPVLSTGHCGVALDAGVYSTAKPTLPANASFAVSDWGVSMGRAAEPQRCHVEVGKLLFHPCKGQLPQPVAYP